jgi:hypothetical protein
MMACYDQKSLEDFTGLPTAIHPDKRDEYRRKVLLTLERVERLKMAVDSSHALPDIMAAHGDGQEDLDMLVAILRIIHPFRGGIDQTGLLTAAPHLPVPYLERNLWTIVELLDLGIDLASRSPSDRGIQPLIIKLCSWSDRYMVGLRWANIDAVRQGLICTGEAPCLPFTYESNGNPVTISSIYFILHRLASNSRFPQIEPVIPVTGAPIIFLS